MSYVFPTLLGVGLTLVALPVLIHLINMLRHRRVKWAAMDFLLQSQKRYKKWVILKQLLLLLMRMAAIAAIAFMIARPLMKNEWGELFGGSQTHHIVLLDDSYSMSERWSGGSAFDRAKQVVKRLADQAGAQGSAHSFSLVRFSGAANLAAGEQIDVIQQNVDSEFSAELTQLLDQLQPSQSAATVSDAFEAMESLPSKSDEESRIVYVVSDFRTNQWGEPTELRKKLDDLDKAKVKLNLVHCVDLLQSNLVVTRLEPVDGIRAAGVGFEMEVSVANFAGEGDAKGSTARSVTLRLEEDGSPRPGLEIKSIAPGETITRRFPVQFATAGPHTVSASLEADAVAADNTRFAVIDIPDTARVLVIDSGEKGADAYMIASAFAPGGKVQTGITPQVEPPQFLRKREELDQFHAIYLLNLERLDDAEIESLEDYVRNGGGVAFFLGERSRKAFFNEHLYRDGEGLFPLPLTLPTDLLDVRVEQSPDIEATEHPIFAPFLAMRNNPLDDVLVERYFAVPGDWTPDPDSTVNVIARLRNGAPLVVEKKFGEGRVVAVLTKASPERTELGQWNNWSRNLTFPVTLFTLQGYLSSGKQRIDERQVGAPLELQLDPAQYKSKIVFTSPRDDDEDIQVVDAEITPEGLQARLQETGQSGLYQASLTTAGDDEEVRYFAYNVDSAEGNLDLLDGQQLVPRLDGLTYRFYRAEDLDYDPQDVAGFSLSEPILYGLIILLILEQLLAYSASYHPPRVQPEEARR